MRRTLAHRRKARLGWPHALTLLVLMIPLGIPMVRALGRGDLEVAAIFGGAILLAAVAAAAVVGRLGHSTRIPRRLDRGPLHFRRRA